MQPLALEDRRPELGKRPHAAGEGVRTVAGELRAKLRDPCRVEAQPLEDPREELRGVVDPGDEQHVGVVAELLRRKGLQAARLLVQERLEVVGGALAVRPGFKLAVDEGEHAGLPFDVLGPPEMLPGLGAYRHAVDELALELDRVAHLGDRELGPKEGRGVEREEKRGNPLVGVVAPGTPVPEEPLRLPGDGRHIPADRLRREARLQETPLSQVRRAVQLRDVGRAELVPESRSRLRVAPVRGVLPEEVVRLDPGDGHPVLAPVARPEDRAVGPVSRREIAHGICHELRAVGLGA